MYYICNSDTTVDERLSIAGRVHAQTEIVDMVLGDDAPALACKGKAFQICSNPVHTVTVEKGELPLTTPGDRTSLVKNRK